MVFYWLFYFCLLKTLINYTCTSPITLIPSLQASFCIDFWSQMSSSEKLMQDHKGGAKREKFPFISQTDHIYWNAKEGFRLLLMIGAIPFYIKCTICKIKLISLKNPNSKEKKSPDSLKICLQLYFYITILVICFWLLVVSKVLTFLPLWTQLILHCFVLYGGKTITRLFKFGLKVLDCEFELDLGFRMSNVYEDWRWQPRHPLIVSKVRPSHIKPCHLNSLFLSFLLSITTPHSA